MRRALLAAAMAVAFGASVWLGAMSFGGGDGHAPDGSIETYLVSEVERAPDVPALPFDDNPDPSQCGIPVPWGEFDNTAWLSGIWEGRLVQPDVFVYDSHLRQSVVGSAPHGTQVEIVLYQENPVLDYYMVRIQGESQLEGWLPEPFLSFDPVT
jgi:hypothetical protein